VRRQFKKENEDKEVSKAVLPHTMEVLGGRGDIVPTHS
jgi:hypothetical protein